MSLSEFTDGFYEAMGQIHRSRRYTDGGWVTMPEKTSDYCRNSDDNEELSYWLGAYVMEVHFEDWYESR